MARPAVGTRATRTLTLTPEHVEMFAQITGDRNPLHFDEEFAAVVLDGEAWCHTFSPEPGS